MLQDCLFGGASGAFTFSFCARSPRRMANCAREISRFAWPCLICSSNAVIARSIWIRVRAILKVNQRTTAQQSGVVRVFPACPAMVSAISRSSQFLRKETKHFCSECSEKQIWENRLANQGSNARAAFRLTEAGKITGVCCMKNQIYRIVSTQGGIHDLAKEVQRLLDDDYELQGGPFVVPCHPAFSFCQALVKKPTSVPPALPPPLR